MRAPDQLVPFNDLKRGAEGQRRALAAAIDSVTSSGWYIHGPHHDAFQEEFADYLGVEHCIAVASGTDALELSIRAVAGNRRGTVVTAANAGGYATTAIRRCQLVPAYADVDDATLCLDPASLATRLSEDVVAVIVTHLYGRMAEVDSITAICAERSIPVIEDCAQSVGAHRAGRMSGAIGDVAAFSFYPTKNLGALGDGGAVATQREDLATRIERLRQYGWSSKYTVSETGGGNSRLDEIQAAVLRVRLEGLDERNSRRREIIGRYVKAADQGTLRVLPAEGRDHVGHLAVARVEAEARDAVRAALSDAGVATDVHYPVPDHRQPAWAADHEGTALPVTEAVSGQVLSLPCFPEMTEVEIELVCRCLTRL